MIPATRSDGFLLAPGSLMRRIRQGHHPAVTVLKPVAHSPKGGICSLFPSHTGRFAQGLSPILGQPLPNGYHVPTVSSPPGIGIFFSELAQQLTCTLSRKQDALTRAELKLLKQTLLTDPGTDP